MATFNQFTTVIYTLLYMLLTLGQKLLVFIIIVPYMLIRKLLGAKKPDPDQINAIVTIGMSPTERQAHLTHMAMRELCKTFGVDPKKTLYHQLVKQMRMGRKLAPEHQEMMDTIAISNYPPGLVAWRILMMLEDLTPEIVDRYDLNNPEVLDVFERFRILEAMIDPNRYP